MNYLTDVNKKNDKTQIYKLNTDRIQKLSQNQIT